ncbi:hypothetical protein VTL71DRAFT_12442 [Oculimacula yallundae]|uniref:Uncharacterized protein n=1 Tax=Oculimacula yallundae TaxID=86028 RepID=A0ABR4CNT9_9HELO
MKECRKEMSRAVPCRETPDMPGMPPACCRLPIYFPCRLSQSLAFYVAVFPLSPSFFISLHSTPLHSQPSSRNEISYSTSQISAFHKVKESSVERAKLM